MNTFIQGYAQSLIAFATAALTGGAVPHGTLEDALHITLIYEALFGRDGEAVAIAPESTERAQ